MDRGYRFDRYRRLRNMIVFAVAVSTIVFSAIYFIFLQQDVAKVWAKIHRAPTTNATGGENQAGACGDDCFLRLALTSADSSYCRNMSANRSDECWRMFSNSLIEACLALNNYSMRMGCVNDFAFLEKNASLCENLQGGDIGDCKERINPPCADLNGTGQELCLAYRYNDSKYCSSSECFLTYATARNDSSACGGLSSDAEKYACRSVTESKDECSLLSGAYTLDYCYQLLAQYSGDFTYCGSIRNGLYKFNCYLSAAVKERNVSYCANNELEYIWECYKNYSLETGSADGCLAITDPYASASRDGCLRTFAIKFSEPSACGYLSTLYMKTNCYADAIWTSANLSAEKCSEVGQEDWMDKCYTQLAVQKNDTGVCDYVQNKDEKARCLEKFAG